MCKIKKHTIDPVVISKHATFTMFCIFVPPDPPSLSTFHVQTGKSRVVLVVSLVFGPQCLLVKSLGPGYWCTLPWNWSFGMDWVVTIFIFLHTGFGGTKLQNSAKKQHEFKIKSP